MGSSGRFGVDGALTVGRVREFYPDPFFEISSTYMPQSITDLFEWCLYYQMTSPIVGPIIQKLATYAVTEFDPKSQIPGIQEELLSIGTAIRLREFILDFSLDRFTFGNAYASVALPLKKYLECRTCHRQYPVSEVRYAWKNFTFHMRCPKCNATGPARVHEEYVGTCDQIRLIRWNPRLVEIRQTGLSPQDKEFKITLPKVLRNRITMGVAKTIETIPQIYIEAVQQKMRVVMDSTEMFHARRPSPSRLEEDSVYGMPVIFPVLKSLFLLQVFYKAQEAIAMEHVVPLRMLFPAARSGADNPYTNINLLDAQKEIERQILRWKRDINYIPIMTLPLDIRQFGGQGRAYMMGPEILQLSQQIITGMGLPISFAQGDSEYSGASVDMKGLENEFKSSTYDQDDLLRFLFTGKICPFMQVKKGTYELGMKPFQRADDVQRLAYSLQLNQLGKLSDKTLLEQAGHAYETEVLRLESEAPRAQKSMIEQTKAQATAQGEAGLISSRYQTKMEQAQGTLSPEQAQDPQQLPFDSAQAQEQPQHGYLDESGLESQAQSGQMGADLRQSVRDTAGEFAALPADQRAEALNDLRRNMPNYAELVQKALSGLPTSTRADNGLPTRRG